jgi:hypothetical protein
MEKKIRKYLLYFIGIIILMTINACITLSIQNWNEHRKMKMEEHQKENKEMSAVIEKSDLSKDAFTPFIKETVE